LTGSGDAEKWKIRLVVLFLMVSAPIGVLSPSAPQLPRYAASFLFLISR